VLDALAADVDGGFDAFVRAHAGAVYSAALRLSGSRADADDLAQETFVRAYRSLRRFDPSRVRALEPRAWLLTITMNLWRNGLRDAARRPPRAGGAPGRALPDPAPGPEEAAESSEQARALVTLLGELPAHLRGPVVLRHVVGLSYAETAAALRCPQGTAKANVARALARLRLAAAEGRPRRAGPAPRPGRAVAPRARKESR